MNPNPLSLGSPLLDEYTRLLLAVDNARKAIHAAQVGGDVNAKFDAKFDAELNRLRAMGELQSLKEREAADMLLRLRFVRECYPGRLEEVIDPRHREELDNIGVAVVDLKHRADETEDAIVTVAERSGVLGGP